MVIEDLVVSCNSLDWTIPEYAIREVANMLPNLDIGELGQELKTFDANRFSNTISMSHETASHYKWFIYRDLERGYSIWLNEFKVLDDRRYGFATTVHNHRYHFASLVLKGCLYQDIHLIKNRDGLTFSEHPVISTKKIEKGNSYLLLADQIHSFNKIEDETLTLLIRSKAINPYSESFDSVSCIIRRHYSLASRLNAFRNLLS